MVYSQIENGWFILEYTKSKESDGSLFFPKGK